MYNLPLIESRISSLLHSRGLSKNKFLSIVGLNKSIFDNMKKGQIPSVDKIHKIADYFDVTTDYLLGRVDTPYYILINEHQNETYDVNVGKLFQQDNVVQRYASRLFEAYSDIYNANTLLQDLLNDKNKKPENSNHIYIVLKYIIIVLSETLTLLKTTYKTNSYKTAIETLTNNKKAKKSYDLLISAMDNKTDETTKKSDINFIIELRHLIAHYDHEQNTEYSNIVNSIRNCKLKKEQNWILYQHDFLFSEIFIELYKKEYNSNASKDDVCISIIKICANVLNLVCNCLTDMLDEFFNKYNLADCILPNNKTTEIKITNPINITANDNTVSINDPTAEKKSNQELALLEIFKNLDVIKQAKLLTYAAELQKNITLSPDTAASDEERLVATPPITTVIYNKNDPDISQ